MAIDENAFFRQATLKICGHLDIEKAMFECLKYLANSMPVDLMCLEIYEPDIKSLRIIARATPKDYQKVDTLIHFDQEAVVLMEKIHTQFKVSGWPDATMISDSDKDPVTRSIMREWGESGASLLHLPLETKGRPLCSIIAAAKGRNRLTDEHARLFSLLKEPFSVAMSNALRYQEVLQLKEFLADDNRFLNRELSGIADNQIIGADFGLKQVMEMVRRVATHDSPVLLSGETGVGKEVIANAIHYLSTRRDCPFIAVNCGAIPENLLDSELFGHEKGAFTGATARKRGRFERANHGTVFLDEMGELPPQAQIRLLRVLQNKEIERVGGSNPISLNIRVIAATNKNLEDMVESHQFREDLWFRLNVFPIHIPPLRKRKDDIPALVRHFIYKKSKELKLTVIPKLGPGAIDRLLAYNWPGNVRELENVVERALIINQGSRLHFNEPGLSCKSREDSSGFGDEEVLPTYHEVISNYFLKVLRSVGGKIHGPGGAAELMGINPSTLRSKIKKMGIHYKRKRRNRRL